MGFINDIAQSAFRVGENGETVYLPNGILSKGRVVNDSVREKQLRLFSKNSYKLLIPVLIFFMWYVELKDPITFIPVLILGIIEYSLKKYLIRGLPLYTGKFKAKKTLENNSEIYYPSVIMIFTALGILFLSLGLLFIFTSEEGAIGIAFFPIFISVVFFGASLYMFKANKSNKAVELDAKKDSRHSL